jgi:two-component system sensor histidine kinase HydH
MDSLSPAKLVSALSHDLRNPLSSIKMAVQTVAGSSALTERDKRRLALATREVRTIERLLGLFAESSRDAPLATEPMAPRQLVHEALSLISVELDERNLRVEVEEREASPAVAIDPLRLRPVLAQVILNLALSEEEGRPSTVVLDRGVGGPSIALAAAAQVRPSELPRLFDPTATFLAPGTGLSLWVLRKLIALHGGTLSAAERPDAGVLFTLTFPP